MQRVGLHVSASGGLEHAPDNAKELEAECFQFFSRSPRGGKASKITNEQARLFRTKCEEYDFESYIHTPYYINFASKNQRIRHGSVSVVREELIRGSLLGVKYVVTHMGSAKDWVADQTPRSALDLAIKGLREVFHGNPKFSSVLLLEISAGAGAVVGNTFEELNYLLEGLGRSDVHVCLDTCHMFAGGYDMRTDKTLEKTMREFKTIVGTPHIKLIHVNDSKIDLGKRADHHEHIGKGYIGEQALHSFLNHKDVQNINLILETKHDTLINNDIKLLKQWRTGI